MEERLLRLPAVLEMTGMSKTRFWEAVRAGDFPGSYAIGPASVAWKLSEVQMWIAARQRRVDSPMQRQRRKAAEPNSDAVDEIKDMEEVEQ